MMMVADERAVKVKVFRMWFALSRACWVYDHGPRTEAVYVNRVALLTTCHTELKTFHREWPEAPDGWLEAFDVSVLYDPGTQSVTVYDTGEDA
jgi:hypothetical protein